MFLWLIPTISSTVRWGRELKQQHNNSGNKEISRCAVITTSSPTWWPWGHMSELAPMMEMGKSPRPLQTSACQSTPNLPRCTPRWLTLLPLRVYSLNFSLRGGKNKRDSLSVSQTVRGSHPSPTRCFYLRGRRRRPWQFPALNGQSLPGLAGLGGGFDIWKVRPASENRWKSESSVI